MERTLIKDLRSAIGQTVELKGWLQTLAGPEEFKFLILRDSTGLAQVAHWNPITRLWLRRSQKWVSKQRLP